jgi:predicted nucleotidyltransferase
MVTAAANKRETIDRITAVRGQLIAHGVRRLALFGSFSRNQQHAGSDVDLLVEFTSGQKSFDNFMAVCELLEESLQRRVEVLTPESLSPHIRPRILEEAEDVVLSE